MSGLRLLARDPSGIAAIEFAIIAPVMIALFCGTIEIGHMTFARAVLEGAITEAARTATATQEVSEADRDAVMRKKIGDAMANFRTAPGKTLTIHTTVYRNFATAYPENFEDTNKNGVYDNGEPFTDRNANGKWDPAQPISGTMGGPGDVVSYTAHFPKRVLFGFFAGAIGLSNGIDLSATTVVRNEAFVKKSAS